jgi:DNA-binding transcriptional ArsR family regulator
MADRRLRLEIDASPAYEFVLSLAAASVSGAAEGLAAEVANLSGGCDMVWVHLLTLAYEQAPPRDPDSLIAAVAATHPRELRLRLLGYYVRWFRRATPPDVIAAAAGGDPAAAARFRATSYPDDPPWQAALAALLPLSTEETRRRLLGLLRRWRAPFSKEYEPGPLQLEVAARRAQAKSLRPEQVLAGVMDGWGYVPEPGMTSLLLIPSVAIWPWSHVFDHEGTKIVCYPLRPGIAGAGGEPEEALAAIGQALGDPRRLRILRLLAGEELTAVELAARLSIGLTTLLHHLARLREAGLLDSGTGRRRAYRLRPEAVSAYGTSLGSFLEMGQESAGLSR